MTTPRIGFQDWAAGIAQPDIPFNDTTQLLDVYVGTSVLSATTAGQPGSPTQGGAYILPASPTGSAWAAFTAGNIAYFRSGTWYEAPAFDGLIARVQDDNSVIQYDGAAWNAIGGGGGGAVAYDIIVALGDETAPITTGTAKVTMRAPRAMTLSAIKASLTIDSSSGDPEFDVKQNGTSLFSTTLTIDATEKTSETATTAAVLATTAIAADDELTFDIATAGTGAAGAKITLVGTAP